MAALQRIFPVLEAGEEMVARSAGAHLAVARWVDSIWFEFRFWRRSCIRYVYPPGPCAISWASPPFIMMLRQRCCATVKSLPLPRRNGSAGGRTMNDFRSSHRVLSAPGRALASRTSTRSCFTTSQSQVCPSSGIISGGRAIRFPDFSASGAVLAGRKTEPARRRFESTCPSCAATARSYSRNTIKPMPPALFILRLSTRRQS